MLRTLYVSVIAAGMFVVRMLILGLMALFQRVYGGAEIRPESREDGPTRPNGNGKFKVA